MEKYIIFCMKEDKLVTDILVSYKKLKDAKHDYEEWKRIYPSDKPILAKVIKRTE